MLKQSSHNRKHRIGMAKKSTSETSLVKNKILTRCGREMLTSVSSDWCCTHRSHRNIRWLL